MTIVRAHCYAYALPLRRPLSLNGHSVTEREGALLRLETDDGRVGWGDAAPLPGFSTESRADALSALAESVRSLPGMTGSVEGEGGLERTDVPSRPASARCAVEAALLELRGRGGSAALGAETRDRIFLNALITGDQTDLRAAGRRLREDGFRATKLKVGRRSVDRDAARTRALADGLGPDVALRLDANRAWAFGEAVHFADAVSDVPLAYIEEPLAEPGRLGAFAERTGVPVALDETTREQSPDQMPAAIPVSAVVLKPTLLGGIAASRRWVDWARSVGAAPVVSSSYESGVGTRLLVRLAAAWSAAPAGLSAHMRLADDVLRPRLALDGPTVEVEQARAGRVDDSTLALVESATHS
jgi:O-succinylbenzoate synthase